MKKAIKSTANGIQTLYVLAKENDQYSIISIEENLNDKSLEVYKVPLISSQSKTAHSIFDKLVKGRALAYTLTDIVCDLLS